MVQSKECGDPFNFICAIEFGLFFARLLLPFAVAEDGNCGCGLEELDLLGIWELEDIKGDFGVFHFLAVVHAIDRCHSLIDEEVLLDVRFDQAVL